MARYINKYPTMTDYTEDTDARDALGKTVSLISSIGSVHYDKGNVGPIPPGPGPTPGYNYVFMNQFISPMPEPIHPYEELPDKCDNFENVVPASWDSNYQSNELVSDIPGAQMLDSDTPIDFSGKGISSGTPCGIVTSDSCPLDEGPTYAITAGSLGNGCTIELWYKSDRTITQENNAWLIRVGVENNNARSLLLSMEGRPIEEYSPIFEYSATLRLSNGSTSKNYNQTIETNWLDGNWHHYAMTYDSTAQVVHFFLDGHKAITIDDAANTLQDIFTNAAHVDFAPNNGYEIQKGRFAQIAVCNECKWTEDFTVPTVAY